MGDRGGEGKLLDIRSDVQIAGISWIILTKRENTDAPVTVPV
jgi:hypothetical protein